MKRRILSMLLAFCMLFSLLPAQALAAGVEKQTDETSENPFTDVKPDDWFYDAVQYAYENGFFKGTSETTFDPNGGMTRGMFITVLGRMAGVDTPEKRNFPM